MKDPWAPVIYVSVLAILNKQKNNFVVLIGAVLWSVAKVI